MAILNAEEKNKNKITAGLLGICLGLLGIHNFYLGYKLRAIIQICLSLACPVLIYLAIYLGLGVAHSTSNAGLAVFAQFLLVAGILMTLATFTWWIIDTVRIFMGKTKDSSGQILR